MPDKEVDGLTAMHDRAAKANGAGGAFSPDHDVAARFQAAEVFGMKRAVYVEVSVEVPPDDGLPDVLFQGFSRADDRSVPSYREIRRKQVIEIFIFKRD